MAGVNAQAPAGTGVTSFKVPRPWELNVPKFTTEDKEDLQEVDDIIRLGQINEDDEKKRLLTSYLPAKKREIWRALTEYAAETSYMDFKKAVLKAYPEMQEDLDGTLEEVGDIVCRE
jgi:NAD-specific glutamate dehydrogenase